MDESATFYRAAGFEVHRYVDGTDNGGHAFVHFNEESVFDLGLQGSASGAACYIDVPDPDLWYRKLGELDYQVTEIKNEAWGMREFTLTDPSGNRLRFGHSTG
jgi:hypothetical protein